jgi:hypothetical protein
MPHCGLGLAAEPGLLPGLLEPLTETTGPSPSARLAGLCHRRWAATELDRFTAHAAECASWRITLRQVDDDVVVGDPIVPRGSRPT